MISLRIHTQAECDIQHIVDYYDAIDSSITDKFLGELYRSFDLLLKSPEAFPLKYKNTRLRYLKRFPFGIHYQFGDKKLFILAVLHTSRDPETWFR